MKVKQEPLVSILDEAYHAKLLEDIDYYAEIAGIPVAMIHEPMATYCSPEECEWITKIMLHREAGRGGLCLTGIDAKHPAQDRMWAMCAALLRNYVDARVVSMRTIWDTADKGEEIPDPTVLLIPNFYVDFSGGKPSTNWQVQILHDVLTQRMIEKKITILYVQSFKGLRECFGEGISSFLEAHWHIM